MAANLHVIDSIPGDHKAEMREMLEKLIAQVDAGELSSIATATVHRDGCTGSGYSTQTNIATQLGAIEVLKKRLLDNYE